MIRRLVLAAAVAGSAYALPSAAQAGPPCYGVFAGEYVLGYCVGYMCTDACFWEAHPVCEQPASSPTDHCATWNTVLSKLGWPEH